MPFKEDIDPNYKRIYSKILKWKSPKELIPENNKYKELKYNKENSHFISKESVQNIIQFWKNSNMIRVPEYTNLYFDTILNMNPSFVLQNLNDQEYIVAIFITDENLTYDLI